MLKYSRAHQFSFTRFSSSSSSFNGNEITKLLIDNGIPDPWGIRIGNRWYPVNNLRIGVADNYRAKTKAVINVLLSVFIPDIASLSPFQNKVFIISPIAKI